MKRKKRRVTGAPAPAATPESQSQTDTLNSWRLYFAAILALGLLTLLAFSNSFSTGFALDNQTLLLGETGRGHSGASDRSLNTGVYEEIADAELAQDRSEDAAVALAEGMFASDDHNKLLGELLKLYQSGVDSKGCAVVPGPHGPTLNPYCDIVRRDLCEATLRAHLPDVHRRLGCPN